MKNIVILVSDHPEVLSLEQVLDRLDAAGYETRAILSTGSDRAGNAQFRIVARVPVTLDVSEFLK